MLAALGYSADQRLELARTIRASRAEVVVDASPARVGDLLGLDIPVMRVNYAFRQVSGPPLLGLVDRLLERLGMLLPRA